MNTYLVLKYPGKEIVDIEKLEIVKILKAENIEHAKDEFLIWLKHGNLPDSQDYYFLLDTEMHVRIEDVGFALKIRRSFQGSRIRPVC